MRCRKMEMIHDHIHSADSSGHSSLAGYSGLSFSLSIASEGFNNTSKSAGSQKQEKTKQNKNKIK